MLIMNMCNIYNSPMSIIKKNKNVYSKEEPARFSGNSSSIIIDSFIIDSIKSRLPKIGSTILGYKKMVML